MKKLLFTIALFIASISLFAQIQVGKKNKSTEEILNNKYCTGLFKSAHGTIIDVEEANIGAYFNILDWMEGRVAGLQVFVTRSGVRVPVIRGSVSGIYVDEMRVDASYLNMLPIFDIAMVKVIKGPFAGAVGNGFGGTIAIYTLHGEDEEEITDNE